MSVIATVMCAVLEATQLTVGAQGRAPDSGRLLEESLTKLSPEGQKRSEQGLRRGEGSRLGECEWKRPWGH